MIYLTKRNGETIGANPNLVMYCEPDPRGPIIKEAQPVVGSRVVFASGEFICVRETVEEIQALVLEFVK